MIWNFVKQKAQSFLEQSVEAVSKPIIGWFKKHEADEKPCHDMVCYTQEVIDLHFRIAYSEYLYARITGSDRGEILKLRKTVEQFCNDEEFLRTGQVNQEAFIEFMISPQGEDLISKTSFGWVALEFLHRKIEPKHDLADEKYFQRYVLNLSLKGEVGSRSETGEGEENELCHSAEKRNLLNSRLMDTALQYYDGYAVRPLILNPSPQGEGLDHFTHPPPKNQRNFFKKTAFRSRGFLRLKIINHVSHCFI